MPKRGESGLSLIVGIDKPVGKTSHDVVNKVRKAYGERRVGHTGTLDPLASGALLVGVGPATRLDRYLTDHDKIYEARITFGTATDTDDAEGAIIKECLNPSNIDDEGFAQSILDGFLGPQMQMPPAYSAIKRGGVKAYEAARKGVVIELEPRAIEVYSATLIDIFDDGRGEVSWDVRLHVSKGTYIRSLARDMGERAGGCAHLGALRRIRSGRLDVSDCISVEQLDDVASIAPLDPVLVLGFPFVFCDDHMACIIQNGGSLSAKGVPMHQAPRMMQQMDCGPASVIARIKHPSSRSFVSMVVGNRLKAVYEYFPEDDGLKPSCIFSTAIDRGMGGGE